MMVDNKTDIITWENLFDDLREYWLDKIAKISVATTEESQGDLSLPLDTQTRLCFFDIPQMSISFYVSNIFPIFISHGYTPIIPTDLISPGGNIIAIIPSIIERASLAVIDISPPTRNYIHELQLAIKRKLAVIIIQEENIDIPSNIEELKEINIFRRPARMDPGSVEVFTKTLEAHITKISPIMIQKLSDEPQRLLSIGEYRSAVISVFSLLEAELRERIQTKKQNKEGLRSIPISQLLDLGVREEILDSSLRNNILQSYKTRSELVHDANKNIDREQATGIVNSIMDSVQKIRSSKQFNSEEKIPEADIETVWSGGGLMKILCSIHRTNARNGRPTVYKVEDLRKSHYSSYSDSNYFMRVIQELANRHTQEIQIDGNGIRLTQYALDKTCEKHDPTYQKDFKY